MKIKVGLILFSIFLILALYGVQPFLGWADDFTDFTQNIATAQVAEKLPISELETYHYDGKSYYMTTVKKWVSESDKEMTFNAKSPPYILTIGVGQRTTNLPGSFGSFVYHESASTQWGALGLSSTGDKGARNYFLKKQGKYTIRISSSGYKWYAKIGQ